MSAYCDDCAADTRADCDCGGCECCCDSPNAHRAAQARDAAYWGAYFGQDHGTAAERRSRLAAMDPRRVSDEQMAEWRALK